VDDAQPPTGSVDQPLGAATAPWRRRGSDGAMNPRSSLYWLRKLAAAVCRIVVIFPPDHHRQRFNVLLQVR